MQLIMTEKEAVDELDDEIDINSSIHDSFINLINNDEELWADDALNLIESPDLIPPCPSNICSTFASEFKDVDTTGLKHLRRYGKKEVSDSIKTKLDLVEGINLQT